MEKTAEFEFTEVLCDMVKNDGLTVADALKMFRDEFKVGLVYCSRLGLIKRLEQAKA